MIVKDKKYPNRVVKNFLQKGIDIIFQNGITDVPKEIALQLLQFSHDYELLEGDFGNGFELFKKHNRIILLGVFSSADGYGKSALHMAEALSKHVDVNVSTNFLNSYDVRKEFWDIVRKGINPDGLIIQYGIGSSFRRLQNPSIGWTMLETYEWPQSWIQNLNKNIDILFVPCESQKQAAVNSGFKGKVEVVPIGVLSAVFYPEKRKKRDDFIFGIAGNLTYRKGVDLLIKAFEQAFEGVENVGLFIKQGHIRNTFWLNKDIGLDPIWKNDPRILTIAEIWTDEEMRSNFYHNIDCYVSPSRGEGMGLTTIEAMLCNIPVILSDSSGLREQHEQGCNYLVKTNRTLVPKNHYGYPEELQAENQSWDEPDLDDLKSKMLEVYNNRSQAKKVAKRGYELALKEFSAEACAQKLINIINTYV